MQTVRKTHKMMLLLLLMMMNALPLNVRLSVVDGSMEGYNHRSKLQHESNYENERNLDDEILDQLQLAKEAKRNNEGNCPEGFAYVASLNRCYSLLSDVLQTRQEASIECRKRHQVAHLPVLENEQQHNAIVDILQKSDHGGTSCPVGLWTSGRRSHPFRSFSWQPAVAASNGTSARTHESSSAAADVVLTYTNWAKNRPWFAYGLNRNCLYMDRSKAWQWNQRSCEAKLCVICQINLF